MGSLVPVIVVIYLVASVVSAVLQSTKKPPPKTMPRIPKVQPAPQRPQAGKARVLPRPAAARTQQTQTAASVPTVSTAPTVKSSTLSQQSRPQTEFGRDSDYGFDSFADWEDEADLDLDAVFDEFDSLTPRIKPRVPTAAKTIPAQTVSGDLASQMRAGFIFSEILREPRCKRPWPAR